MGCEETESADVGCGTGIDAKSIVFGIVLDGEAVGYPVPMVEADGGIVTDHVGSTDIVVFAIGDRIQAFENPGVRESRRSRIQAFENTGFRFERRGETVYADGTTWNPITAQSADGRALERIAGRRLFAFAWDDAYSLG